MILIVLAIIGWTMILTRADGPRRVFARARAFWTSGPLGCPLCTGVYVGVVLAVAADLAEKWPILALVLWAGAGATAAELYDVITDSLRQRAYRDRAVADSHSPEEPPT